MRKNVMKAPSQQIPPGIQDHHDYHDYSDKLGHAHVKSTSPPAPTNELLTYPLAKASHTHGAVDTHSKHLTHTSVIGTYIVATTFVLALVLLLSFFRIFWPIIGINIVVLFVVRRRSAK
jgi:hypothetical protein